MIDYRTHYINLEDQVQKAIDQLQRGDADAALVVLIRCREDRKRLELMEQSDAARNPNK